jgi:hypothetical protein
MIVDLVVSSRWAEAWAFVTCFIGEGETGWSMKMRSVRVGVRKGVSWEARVDSRFRRSL